MQQLLQEARTLPCSVFPFRGVKEFGLQTRAHNGPEVDVDRAVWGNQVLLYQTWAAHAAYMTNYVNLFMESHVGILDVQ